MRFSIIFSADISKKFDVRKTIKKEPNTHIIGYEAGKVYVPSGATTIEMERPSELRPGWKHSAYADTVSLSMLLKFIEHYQLFSIDDIGPNFAVKFSNAGYEQEGLFQLYAIPEAGQDIQDSQDVWRQILRVMDAGAKQADEAPQPLETGGKTDAIPSPKRLQKAAR